MKYAAIAMLVITSMAWADEPVTVAVKLGQKVALTVPAKQSLVLECQPADGTLGAVLGVDEVAKINARIAAMNEAARPRK